MGSDFFLFQGSEKSCEFLSVIGLASCPNVAVITNGNDGYDRKIGIYTEMKLEYEMD